MKFDKKTSFIFLAICYLLIGIFFWSSGHITDVPFPENLFTFLYLTLLWPLIIGMALFYVVAIPAILGLIIALALTVKKQYILATSLVLTFLFLFSSLFLPVTINKHEELSEIKLGLPINFLIQNQNQYDPPLPWQVHLSSALESPTNILWPQFISSFIIVFILVFGIFNVFKIIYSRQRKT
ncbi:hypothetical protein L6250_04200 [Candidatus Parcubacteria bacterium]|nr:hypothetical protein [Patescibacteria group bacterium]MCG2688801.1 hypothetical protein [Candidatus Parcubacteria bacterium]